ncbi:MAG: hypothetical protein WCO80_05145 [Betaproteobacteria bacterium]|jgi:hypothetical protein|nr:hypothetical protein [Betaproteobacteria bacterium]NBT68802.1 hypothetical protein [Betaproteobacteria bacterium]NBY08030.1 hypothetical protein [Betaproteobacteria bacterium]
MKNKTLAAWLTFLGGPLGLHRLYLFGLGDTLAWLLPIPTTLGLYGLERSMDYGVDDVLSWWLLPLLGFSIAGNSLMAIVYALMSKEQWNQKFNPESDIDSAAGQTQWLTIGVLVVALMVGATSLLSGLVYSFQRYFETQIEEARKISQ